MLYVIWTLPNIVYIFFLLLLVPCFFRSVAPSGVEGISSMSYRQLEEAINKWTIELEEQETQFIQQATQVNAWDRLLIDNADRVC